MVLFFVKLLPDDVRAKLRVVVVLVIYGLALSFVPHEYKTSFIEIDARCIIIAWRICVDCIFDDFFMFLIFFLYNMDRSQLLPMVLCGLIFIHPWEKTLYGIFLHEGYLRWILLNNLWRNIMVVFTNIVGAPQIHHMCIFLFLLM